MDFILETLNDMLFVPVIEFALSLFMDMFEASINVLKFELAKTPQEFGDVVSVLRGISDDIILPIAGIILAAILAYELIDMLNATNNMGDFNFAKFFNIFFKTSLSVMIVSNCFPFILGIFEVGQSLVLSVQVDTSTLPNVVETITESIGADVGMGLMLMLLSFVVCIAGLGAVLMIYLIAWSRMITILIYISVAPIPFATLLNKDWIGQIGQNYLKNLFALGLQGFLMMICLVIYNEIIKMTNSIAADGGIIGIIMIMVCMFVLVKSLMSCLNVAKSIMGAQ